MPLRTTLHCLCGVLLFTAPPLQAQSGRASHRREQRQGSHLISAGAYAALGVTTAAQPTGRHGGVQGQIGMFADYARYALRPGMDARLAGQSFSLLLSGILSDGAGLTNGTATEKLIGSRLSYAKGVFHPYVEALFGKGYESNISLPGNQLEFFANAVAKYAVAGVDFDAERHAQFRVEYSAGRIGSPQSFLIQNFTAGMVFRFP